MTLTTTATNEGRCHWALSVCTSFAILAFFVIGGAATASATSTPHDAPALSRSEAIELIRITRIGEAWTASSGTAHEPGVVRAPTGSVRATWHGPDDAGDGRSPGDERERVRWRLVSVDGPGRLLARSIAPIEASGEAGGDVLFNSAAPPGHDLTEMVVETETSGLLSWEATTPGRYEIVFAIYGDTAGERGHSWDALAPALHYLTFLAGPTASGAGTSEPPGERASEAPSDTAGTAPEPPPGGLPSDATPVGGPDTHPGPTGSSPLTGQTILDRGHVDLAARIDGGALTLSIKDDATTPGQPIYRPPEQVVLNVRSESRTQVPDSPVFSFLGVPGAPIWLLPQVQDPALLWPGWNTEGISSGSFVGNQVRFNLLAAEGPGRMVLFTTDQFGSPTVLIDSGSPLPVGFDTPTGSHAHGNWAFTAEGVYRLTMEVAGIQNGLGLATARAVITFTVGDVPPPAPPPPPPPPSELPSGGGPVGPGTPAGQAGQSASGGGTGADDRQGGGSGSGGSRPSTTPRTGAETRTLALLATLLVVGGLLVLRASANPQRTRDESVVAP